MGEVEGRLLDITSDEAEESEEIQNAKPKNSTRKPLDSYLEHFKWWIELAIYTFLSLGGQAGATLLGKVYFDQGGSSKWLVATLQTAGFPFLIPFLLLSSSKKIPNQNTKNNTNNFPFLALVYTFLGLLLAAGGVFYSVGIEYLSASTYSLLISTQLAFTAVLALFINAQKFTPFILNSVVLLTFSPILLVLEKDDNDDGADDNFVLGALCTVGTAASFALLFSLTELAFQKLTRVDVESYQAIPKLTSKVDVKSYQDLQHKFTGADVGSYQDLQQKFTGVDVGSYQDLQQKFTGVDVGSYQDLQKRLTSRVDVGSHQDLQQKFTLVDVESYQDLQQNFTGVDVGLYQAMQKKLTSRVDVGSHPAMQKFTGVDVDLYLAMMETLKMTLWQSVVATVVTLVGLLWSGEWRGLRGEMEGYKQGVVSYFINVVGTAVSCQAYYVGSIALTFKVSSLFSNVVIRLATPVIPFLSVVFLHEEMSGLKVTALLLSVWGFASYIYQQYLDENQSNEDIK